MTASVTSSSTNEKPEGRLLPIIAALLGDADGLRLRQPDGNHALPRRNWRGRDHAQLRLRPGRPRAEHNGDEGILAFHAATGAGYSHEDSPVRLVDFMREARLLPSLLEERALLHRDHLE